MHEDYFQRLLGKSQDESQWVTANSKWFICIILFKKTKTKQSSTKSLSRNTTVEAVTEKNVSNKVVSNIDDGGVKVAKLTNQKSKNNVSNKVVSNIDDGVDEKIISDVILNENITTPITSKTKVTNVYQHIFWWDIFISTL